MDDKITQEITQALFEHREKNTSHFHYAGEMAIFSCIRNGDSKMIKKYLPMFLNAGSGKLSDNPVTNYRYLFICSTTLATRYAIEGGLVEETAYSLSDVYIRQVDKLNTIDEIYNLYKEMMVDFTIRVHNQESTNYSKQISNAVNYINTNLHSNLSADKIAEEVFLSSSYFCKLFKKEVGYPVSFYIRKQRIDAAKNLLRYSNYSILDISNYLSFCSQSRFSEIFKEDTSYTPKQYRDKFFNSNFK